mmetsp:Transcript_30139/g.65817  ORF Transcript_30139/g.65817 Transcript_30139/m.65817 type:complete len:174 (-) Transcript_30139:110-631(-)
MAARQRSSAALVLSLAVCCLAAAWSWGVFETATPPAFANPMAQRSSDVTSAVTRSAGMSDSVNSPVPGEPRKSWETPRARKYTKSDTIPRDPEVQVGEEAYGQPPNPTHTFGSDERTGTGKVGECNRKYLICYEVCRRKTKQGGYRKTCKYDCDRARRACYWWARPEEEKWLD